MMKLTSNTFTLFLVLLENKWMPEERRSRTALQSADTQVSRATPGPATCFGFSPVLNLDLIHCTTGFVLIDFEVVDSKYCESFSLSGSFTSA